MQQICNNFLTVFFININEHLNLSVTNSSQQMINKALEIRTTITSHKLNYNLI